MHHAKALLSITALFICLILSLSGSGFVPLRVSLKMQKITGAILKSVIKTITRRMLFLEEVEQENKPAKHFRQIPLNKIDIQ